VFLTNACLLESVCPDSSCSDVPYPIPLNPTTASELLQDDLKEFEGCISDYVTVGLNANQYGALCSWSFNVGCGNAESSTLISRLNSGEDPNTVASQELPKWDKSGGQTLPGLTRRRAAEVVLFTTGNDTAPALPC
jgi:lysozyme